MPISTIGQNGLNAPITLTSPVINTVTSAASTALTLQSAGTTAITVDTSQNVGIGTTSPTDTIGFGRCLDIRSSAGAGIYLRDSDDTTNDTFAIGRDNADSYLNSASGNILFFNAGSERMRIDSSGNVMVGSTSRVNDSILSATQSANTGGFGVLASNASYTATVICGSTSRASSSNFDFLGMYTNGTSTAQFRVGGNGVIYAQNTSVQSISDQRLKENIRDSSDGLAVVNALRPVRYDWKKGYGNDQKNQLGFIAQEIETVFPESVSEWQINKDEETTYKTVGPSALIPVLVKAIQELKTIVDAQAAEIAELKAKVA
jgi:hypothetical protein